MIACLFDIKALTAPFHCDRLCVEKANEWRLKGRQHLKNLHERGKEMNKTMEDAVGRIHIWGTDIVKDGDTYTCIKTGGWTPIRDTQVLIRGKAGDLVDAVVTEIIDKDTFTFTADTKGREIFQFWGFGFHTETFCDVFIQKAIEAENDELILRMVKDKFKPRMAKDIYQMGCNSDAKRLLDFLG